MGVLLHGSDIATILKDLDWDQIIDGYLSNTSATAFLATVKSGLQSAPSDRKDVTLQAEIGVLKQIFDGITAFVLDQIATINRIMNPSGEERNITGGNKRASVSKEKQYVDEDKEMPFSEQEPGAEPK